jgi:hypothetical protein
VGRSIQAIHLRQQMAPLQSPAPTFKNAEPTQQKKPSPRATTRTRSPSKSHCHAMDQQMLAKSIMHFYQLICNLKTPLFWNK